MVRRNRRRRRRGDESTENGARRIVPLPTERGEFFFGLGFGGMGFGLNSQNVETLEAEWERGWGIGEDR